MKSAVNTSHAAEIAAKAAEYEALGWFDKDLDDNPPTRPLDPNQADYLGLKFSSKVKTAIANFLGDRYFRREIRHGNLVIDRINGINCFKAVANGGAIITCNHISPYDNYAVYTSIKPYLGGKKLYKVIREGNYTSFPGLFGFLFRNCNTLPLAKNHTVMREMMIAADTLLRRGEKILIYPEQALWRNYKKPRPLKSGAFFFAAKSGVPVLPIFITSEDTDKLTPDGFTVQKYTVNILPPIYPNPEKSVRENTDEMCRANAAAWKDTYEKAYQTGL